MLTSFLFYNCGSPKHMVSTSDSSLPQSHPPLASSASGLTQNRLLLGDAFYVLSVFRDVFTFENSSEGVRTFVEKVLTEEILTVQGEYGRACSVFHDGSLEKCNGILYNQSLTMKSTSSSLREAARIQTCQRLVSNDTVLMELINRIRKTTTTPSRQSIEMILKLFFPTQDSTQDFIEPLLKLDQKMAEASEKTIDRWRLITLAICEEPGWQLL